MFQQFVETKNKKPEDDLIASKTTWNGYLTLSRCWAVHPLCRWTAGKRGSDEYRCVICFGTFRLGKDIGAASVSRCVSHCVSDDPGKVADNPEIGSASIVQLHRAIPQQRARQASMRFLSRVTLSSNPCISLLLRLTILHVPYICKHAEIPNLSLSLSLFLLILFCFFGEKYLQLRRYKSDRLWSNRDWKKKSSEIFLKALNLLKEFLKSNHQAALR